MSCRVLQATKNCYLGIPENHRFGVPGRPGGVKIGPQRRLGPILEPLQLLEASWSGLGGLLERSWTALRPKKSPLDRLLAAPRGFPRQVSAILRAKRLPKRSPGGSQIGSWRRLELKVAKIIFEVPGHILCHLKRVQNGFRIASSTWKPSECLLEASWSAVGASWSGKNKVGIALGGSYRHFKTGFS